MWRSASKDPLYYGITDEDYSNIVQGKDSRVVSTAVTLVGGSYTCPLVTCLESWSHLSHIRYHLSRVICHISYVRMSQVTKSLSH